MKYRNTVYARFLDRPNRFIAHVELEGKTETVHVKNTGRCRELLLSGSEVILAGTDNPIRKTKYDLVAVNKPGLGWVNIDSQAPNRVVREWLDTVPELFADVRSIRQECPCGKSRIDFYLESDFRKIWMEVKGCTLERGLIGYFPDAPTDRGIKHLRELQSAAENGYECYIAFVIAMPSVKAVLPNTETHPEFAAALAEARSAGVNVLYLPCRVEPDGIVVEEYILEQGKEIRKWMAHC